MESQGWRAEQYVINVSVPLQRVLCYGNHADVFAVFSPFPVDVASELYPYFSSSPLFLSFPQNLFVPFHTLFSSLVDLGAYALIESPHPIPFRTQKYRSWVQDNSPKWWRQYQSECDKSSPANFIVPLSIWLVSWANLWPFFDLKKYCICSIKCYCDLDNPSSLPSFGSSWFLSPFPRWTGSFFLTLLSQRSNTACVSQIGDREPVNSLLFHGSAVGRWDNQTHRHEGHPRIRSWDRHSRTDLTQWATWKWDWG